MFSKELSKAVASAQNCIDICCSKDNVLMIATEHIETFVGQIKALDPSEIDFYNKNIINNLKIKSYWKRFEKDYPEVKSIIRILEKDSTIIKNTLLSIEAEQKRLHSAFNDFKNLEHNENDMEYLQQYTVSENIVQLMDNLYSSYNSLSLKVSMLLKTSNVAFDTAIAIAKTSDISHIADYKIKYTELINIS